jgi:hypothetical protein
MNSYADKNGKDRPSKRTRKVGTGYDAEFRGYINLQLTDEQKLAYVKWAESSSLWEVLEASVSSGVNLSLKLDPKGHGCLASATQRAEASPNAGLVVTARGKDAGTAWGRVLFCLALLSHKDRWEDTQPLADPDLW